MQENKEKKIRSFTTKTNKIKATVRPSVAQMVENIVGCKWSLEVLSLVHCGVCRPGAMTRAVEGLTTKVLNERLSKMVRFGILTKIAYPEIPPRVEYELTAFGKRFVGILDAINMLEEDMTSATKLQ